MESMFNNLSLILCYVYNWCIWWFDQVGGLSRCRQDHEEKACMFEERMKSLLKKSRPNINFKIMRLDHAQLFIILIIDKIYLDQSI